MYILHRETKERFIGKEWANTEKNWFIVFEEGELPDAKTYKVFPHVEVHRYKTIQIDTTKDYNFSYRSQNTRWFNNSTDNLIKKFIIDKTMRFLEDQGEL